MKSILSKTKLLSASLVLAMSVAGTASAATVTFGTASNLNGVAQLADDGSGLTSAFVPATNVVVDPTLGYFVETFDAATGPDLPLDMADPEYIERTKFNVDGKSTGCALNSSGVSMTASAPGVANVRTGTEKNVAAAPLNDDSCYAYTTPAGPQPSFVDIDYSQFLTDIGKQVPALDDSFINSLGFYWGSVDTYNSFEFYNGDTLVSSLTGTELLNELGGTSGDQLGEKSNAWVQIAFTAAESFDRLRIITSGVAGEFDNITIGLDKRPSQPVPAPTGLAFLGLGLLGLSLKKRLKK